MRHPVFARCWGILSRFMERDVGEYRGELLAGLSGRVIEVGAGNGLNFSRYPATTRAVVAVEPEAYLRRSAERAAAKADVDVSVHDGLAQRLPFADDQFDAAVASLVLCSVPEQGPALAELRGCSSPGVSCVSSSTCARRLRARPGSSGNWTEAGCGHCSVGAATARGTRWRRSRRRDSRSSGSAGSRSDHRGRSATRSRWEWPGSRGLASAIRKFARIGALDCLPSPIDGSSEDPWPARSVLAGTAGTAALTLAYAVERRLRGDPQGSLDYDDSLVPGQIVVRSSPARGHRA